MLKKYFSSFLFILIAGCVNNAEDFDSCNYLKLIVDAKSNSYQATISKSSISEKGDLILFAALATSGIDYHTAKDLHVELRQPIRACEENTGQCRYPTLNYWHIINSEETPSMIVERLPTRLNIAFTEAQLAPFGRTCAVLEVSANGKSTSLLVKISD